MACSSLSRGRFDDFIANANEAIFIKLIANETDLNEETSSGAQAFHPEFSHQVFGDNETIFGYKQLKAKLYYSAARLDCYLGMTFSEKVTREETDGIEADEVLTIIANKLEGHFIRSLDEFSASLSKEASFKPYGQLVNSFSIDDHVHDGTKRHFEIFNTDFSVPGFSAYHERMRTFLLWFIDAASYIDQEDDRWQFFVVFEKQYETPKNSLSNGHSANCETFNYCFVGYASVYRYYAYPQKTRPRISQFLILPPFQKRGLGVKLLQTVYDSFSNDSNVIDITVEDPSDNFTRIRDFVDSLNCQKLDSFQKEKLKLGWSEDMATEAQAKLKISKRQTRRVYEVLRFRITDRSNEEEYKAYRLIVKQRLNAPFQKQLIDYEKLQKTGRVSETELAHIKQTILLPNDVRLDQLTKLYRDLEDEYQHIIERLASS